MLDKAWGVRHGEMVSGYISKACKKLSLTKSKGKKRQTEDITIYIVCGWPGPKVCSDRTKQKTCRTSLVSIYWALVRYTHRAQRILRDNGHPSHGLPTLMLPGKWSRSTTSVKAHLFCQAELRIINKWTSNVGGQVLSSGKSEIGVLKAGQESDGVMPPSQVTAQSDFDRDEVIMSFT